MSSFRITGLDPATFRPLFGRSDDELAAHGVVRCIVDAHPGFPDRIEMRDLEIGERALLLNYTHLDVATPYRSSHAIFVREGATERYDRTNEIPTVMRSRQLSVRAFDPSHMMIDAEVINGIGLADWIAEAFADSAVAYIHVHNAKRGCFSGRVDRA